MSEKPESMNAYDMLYHIIQQLDYANQERITAGRAVDLTPNITGVDPELDRVTRKWWFYQGLEQKARELIKKYDLQQDQLKT